MAHLQYMPGDPRLVDQLVYELKSKGIFDQFRKDCIADVDTRPAYQNLRQRVENSVASFLSRQCWQPDLNKNQLREKLRKHLLEGNYLEQGVERIVDQVVNPKVASVFIPQVEDLVYNYLGISKKKSVTTAETSNGKISTDDLLPTDLEAVSPGSVKSNDDKNDTMDNDFTEDNKMEVDETKDEDKTSVSEIEKAKIEGDSQSSIIDITHDSQMSIDKNIMSMHEDIRVENIPPPDNSPPKIENAKIELEKIELPKEPNIATEIPNPGEIPLPVEDKEQYFKPIGVHSDDDSSSDSSLRRNMSPLTPIRNYNNENSCDAQQAFENDSDSKSYDKKEPSTFRFANIIESKSPENSLAGKPEKKDNEQSNLAYQFNSQVNINTFNTPMYDDSSNSNNLQIDYESDANSKINIEKVPEVDQNSEDKREKKSDDRKSSHKSSHRSRDSHRHSSSKDKRSDSKQSTSRDSSRHDKKSNKDDHSKSKSSHKEREKSRDRGDKKDSRDSSKYRSSSHKSSSSQRDSKSYRSSSSSQKHSSDKRSSDDKKSSSSQKDKSERSSEKSSDRSSRDKKDSKSSSHRQDKDKKSSKSKNDDKDKKKDKKDTDDHYSLSGRGNHGRRSTDRDSNDGSSSSKGSQNQSGTKSTESKKESKESSSKSDNTSTTSNSTSPSDKDIIVTTASTNQKPIRVENHLEIPIASPPRLPFVPDVTLKKPKFAANLEEAKRMMKMRKFLDEEQKRMNQEAALLLEFQANVRPSLSQVYSSIPGPELEFACVTAEVTNLVENKVIETAPVVEGKPVETIPEPVQENELEEIKKELVKTDPKKEDTSVDTNEVETTQTDTEMKVEEEELNTDKNESYNENKPFSQLMDEISQYSKASEKNKKDSLDSIEDVNKNRTEYFEVTIITEELSETEEPVFVKVPEIHETTVKAETEITEMTDKLDTEIVETTVQPEIKITETILEPDTEIAETTLEPETEITETAVQPDTEMTERPESVIPETHVSIISDSPQSPKTPEPVIPRTSALIIPKNSENTENETLKYFAEQEKFDAELKRQQYGNFLKSYQEKNLFSNKIHIINCDTYEENILQEVSATFGTFEVINYYKNGHLKLPKTAKNVVKNVNLATEISLPVDSTYESKSPSPVFSPVKSECSFELSSDYDAKLEEMVNKTSRQQVMEIILGNIIDESDNPTIDYCTESSIDNELHLKRKAVDVECSENNNRHVLAKMRKLSGSDQISSTTEEGEEVSNNNRVSNPTRSKYLGRARRVGLSRPKRTNLPNSPSSDKSVENYEQNTQTAPQTPNGKLKTVTRNKVQRYDTSDLYKPKLHYLSRRNNIS